MGNILHRPIGKELLVIIGLISLIIVYINFSSTKNEVIQPQTGKIPMVSSTPLISNKNLKAGCVNESLKYAQDNKNKGLSNSAMIYGINATYRICLARNGLTPEDLLTNGNISGTSGLGGNAEGGPTETSDYSQDTKQWCQKLYTEYNTCLAEYNAKIAEFNQCINQGSGFCYKPSNFCFKPPCNL